MSETEYLTDPQYGSISVSAYGTLTNTELAPLLDELRGQFLFVRTTTTQMTPPMAGGPDVGVVLALSVDALSDDLVRLYLLHVLTKWAEADAAAFRKAILEAFRRVKSHNQAHRKFLPGVLECGRVRFYFDEELEEKQFIERVKAAKALVESLPAAQVAGRAGPGEYGFHWNSESKDWQGEIFPM